MAAKKVAKKAAKKAAKAKPTTVTKPTPRTTPAKRSADSAPREPLAPEPDQRGPDAQSPTGRPTGTPAASVAQAGAYLTTAQGARLSDSDHSLKAGPRGPVLIQDHQLRERITHFDHERIPERVVHARGAAAHGVFTGYGTAAKVTKAAFLAKGVETPVFVRFSTVLGSRGSADSVRDTRGFATKFFTGGGTFDLVGNNMPVFFIQDAVKFPDVIHAGKPQPDREIPQAQSAHDTFWDFVSLHTEATHHTLWNMSDRGIPRSYRMMEGFGVHTFRLVDAEGTTTLVKFHWKPKLGVHSLVWEEAQIAAGTDPDLHRRDLADAIEAGAFPQWELGIQTFPDTSAQTFEGIDLLDPTKLVPEELAEVRPIGLMTLNANPLNYFAETEQVAFHPGHLVPGIDVTDDPLLAGRLFSYLDTQISRLGGPNFAQIPVNRPHAPVNDTHRDGLHQDAVHTGVAPYRLNSLGGGCPFLAGVDEAAFIEVPTELAPSRKVRAAPESFDDHFGQPRLFWLSMTPVERAHTVAAYTFELANCQERTVKERVLTVLANIDTELCARVASGLGLPAPAATEPLRAVEPSPALSQLGSTWPVDGRVIGIVAGPDSKAAQIAAAREAVLAAGMAPLVIAPTGTLPGRGKTAVTVQKTYATARSTAFDALLVAGSPADSSDPRVLLLLSETFRHAKAIGAVAGAEGVLTEAGVPTGAPGIIVGSNAATTVKGLAELLAEHRVWDRFPA
ncbi:catalase [Streptomyces sp. NPDC098789]|uniref:catalase n=1 Tax=Streptomyces sp. NPDC098789 TaxID=3366098 RepID=UPI00382F498E